MVFDEIVDARRRAWLVECWAGFGGEHGVGDADVAFRAPEWEGTVRHPPCTGHLCGCRKGDGMCCSGQMVGWSEADCGWWWWW